MAESTYLDRIVTAHRATAAADRRPLDRLGRQARSAPPVRGFRIAIERSASSGDLAVIAEIKRRSPSKGELAPDLDPAEMAREYAAGGAACLSVLTDKEFFGGSAQDLAAARKASPLPVLRKDFTVSARDLYDARLMGADAVLLIAAALDLSELGELHAVGVDLGLDVLVEINDEVEADRALAAGATMIGVNQRDLITFQVDTDRALRLAPALPDGVVRIAESGITGPGDAAVLAAAGYHAVLVGESLVRAPDPRAAVDALRRSRSAG